MVLAQVAHERRWTYEHWMDHVPIGEMRRLSAHDPDRGGLGYELSESALRGLLRMAQAENGVGEHDKAVELARELEDIEAETLTVNGSIQRLGASILDLAEMSDGRVIHEKAELLLYKALQRRAVLRDQRVKLLGLNAPEKSEVDVTIHDAVTDELNAQLAALDLPPIRDELNR